MMSKKVTFKDEDLKKSSWTENLDAQVTKAKQQQIRQHHKLLLFGRTTRKHHLKDEEKMPNSFDTSGNTSFSNRLLHLWVDDESVLRLCWTSILVVLFSLIAAGIFYGIESNSDCDWDYWRCLWMVNTIYTTIGYGTLRPCTGGGRAAVIAFALIGIPLNIIALADIGKLLARCLSFVWIHVFQKCLRALKRKCFKKSRDKPSPTGSEKSTEQQEISQIPLTFALLVTLLWILISASFFFLSESDHMTYADALYFIMISVTTIGLGDVTPTKHYLVIVQFFFIIIGIALFSMVINIIQDKMDVLSNLVEKLITQEYARTQTEGGELVSDEKSAREHIKEIIKRQKGGSFMQLLMGKTMENRLVEDYLEKSRKRLASTQTDNEVLDKEIMAVASIRDQGVQAVPELLHNRANSKSTQISWMPKVWQYTK